MPKLVCLYVNMYLRYVCVYEQVLPKINLNILNLNMITRFSKQFFKQNQ